MKTLSILIIIFLIVSCGQTKEEKISTIKAKIDRLNEIQAENQKELISIKGKEKSENDSLGNLIAERIVSLISTNSNDKEDKKMFTENQKQIDALDNIHNANPIKSNLKNRIDSIDNLIKVNKDELDKLLQLKN